MKRRKCARSGRVRLLLSSSKVTDSVKPIWSPKFQISKHILIKKNQNFDPPLSPYMLRTFIGLKTLMKSHLCDPFRLIELRNSDGSHRHFIKKLSRLDGNLRPEFLQELIFTRIYSCRNWFSQYPFQTFQSDLFLLISQFLEFLLVSWDVFKMFSVKLGL